MFILKFCGKDIGSGTDVWKFSDDVRTGEMSLQSFIEAEACMSRSAGRFYLFSLFM